MIRHHVFLKFSDTTTQAERDSLMTDLAALRTEIDGILSFAARQNVSPETDFTHGFTEMFWFDFGDLAARDAYLANETHKAVGARLFACLDGGAKGIFVCDVEV